MTYGWQHCGAPFRWQYGEIDHRDASAAIGEQWDPGRTTWNGQLLHLSDGERRGWLNDWADQQDQGLRSDSIADGS